MREWLLVSCGVLAGRLEEPVELLVRDELALEKLLLDLVERLLAEVAQRKELLETHRDQLADARDVVGLEAVERAHAELEMAGEQPLRLAHRLDGRHGAVGPHLDEQAIPLRPLADARLLDGEVG